MRTKNSHPAPQNTPFLCPARRPTHVVLRGQGQHLTGFYWLLFLLCSADCRDTKANLRSRRPLPRKPPRCAALERQRRIHASAGQRGPLQAAFHAAAPIRRFPGRKKRQPALSLTSCGRREPEHLPVWEGGGERPLGRHHTKRARLRRHARTDLNTPLYEMWMSPHCGAQGVRTAVSPISYMINQITPRGRGGK